MEVTVGDRTWRPGEGQRSIVFLVGNDTAFAGLIFEVARYAVEKHGVQSVLLRNPRACSDWRLESPYLLVGEHEYAALVADNPFPSVTLVDESGMENAQKTLMAPHAQAWPPLIDKWVLDSEHYAWRDSLLQFMKAAPTFVARDTKGRLWSSADFGATKKAIVSSSEGCGQCVGALETVASMDDGFRDRILVVVHPNGGPGSKEYAGSLSDSGWDVLLDEELCRLFDWSVIPSGVCLDADGHLTLATQRGDQTFTEWLLKAVG